MLFEVINDYIYVCIFKTVILILKAKDLQNLSTFEIVCALHMRCGLVSSSFVSITGNNRY